MSDEKALEFLASLPTTDAYKQDPSARYNDFRTIFGSDAGKRVLAEILSWCHLLRTSVGGNPIDPYRTHVSDGERNIGIRLLATVTVDPPQRQERTRIKPVKSRGIDDGS